MATKSIPPPTPSASSSSAPSRQQSYLSAQESVESTDALNTSSADLNTSAFNSSVFNSSAVMLDLNTSTSNTLPSLHRFTRAKEEITSIFKSLSTTFLQVTTFLKRDTEWVQHKNDGTTEAHQSNFDGERKLADEALKGTNEAVVAVSREFMKVAFVGCTSTGKSATVNAILREQILPSGIGHTTNCFCCLKGTEEASPYITLPNSNLRHNIQDVDNLADALSDKSLDVENLVEIHWPTQRCPILAENVVVIDSPGMGMRTQFDQWIRTHCADADVFILVANAESVLSEVDKMFFREVKNARKPNVFVQYNRWDCTDEESGRADKVMRQHINNASELLCDELGLLKREQINDRVFFVSAREALNRRIDPTYKFRNQGNAEKRYKEFLRFEKSFSDCISTEATRTRFLEFAVSGVKRTEAISSMLGQVCLTLSIHVSNIDKHLASQRNSLAVLQKSLQKVRADCDMVVEQIVGLAKTKLLTTFDTEVTRSLSGILDQFSPSSLRFDPNNIGPYKDALNKHMEDRMGNRLRTVCAAQARPLFQDAQLKLYELVNKLVPGNNDLNKLVKKTNYDVDFSLDGAALTQNFREHIQFQFSFGISRIAPSLAAQMPAFFGETSRTSSPSPSSSSVSFASQLPATSSSSNGSNGTATTISPSSSSSSSSSSSRGGSGVSAFLSTINAMQVVNSAASFFSSKFGMATLTFGSLALRSKATAKPLLYGAALVGAVYMFEYCMYTTQAMERKYKRQMADYATKELKLLAHHTSRSESNGIKRELTAQVEAMFTEIDRIQKKLSQCIEDNSRELAVLQGQIAEVEQLKASVAQGRESLQDFLKKHVPAEPVQ